MKQAKRLTAVILALLLCLSQFVPAFSEGSFGLDALMEGVAKPASYTLNVNPMPAEGSDAQAKTVTVSFVSDSGEGGQAVIELAFYNFKNLDDGFAQQADAYAELVREAAEGTGAIDPEGFANKLNQAIDTMHQFNRSLAQKEIDARAAEAEETAEVVDEPVPEARVLSVAVSAPYYAPLQRGSRGEDAKRLQQKLIDLGFLEGEADGQFGPGTETGVKALQQHVRNLEAEQLEALMPDPTPIPAEGEEATPVTKPEPATELNGIADSNLLAYLFSDKFSIASARLEQGAEGPAVRRLQNRLVALGYMYDAPTGTYGPATAQGVRVFARYNDMIEDGIATRQMQELLYSTDAKTPPFPVLGEGSKGDDVRTLQKRLKLLGFMTGEVDGYYGASTVRGVKNLQQYLWKVEEQKLIDAAIAERDMLYPENLPSPSPEPMLDVAAAQELEDEIAADPMMQSLPIEEEAVMTASRNPVLSAIDYLFGAEVAHAESFAEQMFPTSEPELAATPRPTPRPIDTSVIKIEANGIADPDLQALLYAPEFPLLASNLQPGSKGIEVERLQRRLVDLEYMFITPDGDYGNVTQTAVSEFQTRNALEADGFVGERTVEVLLSDSARKALKPFMLKISIEKQRVYAYAPDENEEYTRLVRTMKCSTGLNATPTPKGTFQGTTGPGARWHFFKKFNCWAQYAYYIEGDIMIHSVLYSGRGTGLQTGSVYNLGRKASHGCVRMAVEDAKWVWNNCPAKTKIVVY